MKNSRKSNLKLQTSLKIVSVFTFGWLMVRSSLSFSPGGVVRMASEFFRFFVFFRTGSPDAPGDRSHPLLIFPNPFPSQPVRQT